MTPEQMLAQEFGTIPALVRLHAEREPDRVALVLDGRCMNYRELDVLMGRIAAGLQRDGVRPRDAVAICAASSPEYAAVFFGGLRAGAAVAPLSPTATAESLRAMVEDSGAKHFFLDAAVAATLAPAEMPDGVKRISLDGSNAGVPLDDWLPPEGSKPKEIEAAPDDPFNIIYSSGTTGTPKGIVQPNSMRWAHVRRGMFYGYGAGAITMISTPLYSNTTLVSFLPTIALGGTAVLMQKFDVEKFLALCEQERVSHAMLVPAQYKRIMEHPNFGKYDLSNFRAKFSTSAPFPAALKADVLKRWPGGLIDSYGLTEGGGTCVLFAHEFPEKLHTVGKPAPGHDIRLIGEDGREAAKGEAGEVVGRSAIMMTEYHNRPDLTAAAEWFDAGGNRFLRTGDIGRFDDDGFLTLIDRRKDMIISGGFNVYPSDLEAVLARHEAVAEAAVVGTPSACWGETPVAFVVLREGHDIAPEALREWANQQLGKTQRIAEIRLKNELPRSPIGKVLKRELRRELPAGKVN
jgi:acyl-CoA synthetase (AMP-forming)/AMP-acid ligase II